MQTGNKFLDQWDPLYPSKVFCFTLPHVVGGPEYDPSRRGRRGVRLPDLDLDCPVVISKAYTRGMARRIEGQIRADWVLVPAHAIWISDTRCSARLR